MEVKLEKKPLDEIVKDLLFRLATIEVKVKKLEQKCSVLKELDNHAV